MEVLILLERVIVMTTTKKTLLQNDFIEKINNVYEKCIGTSSYGSTTEFYDEDGIILMCATQDSNGKILFNFGEEDDYVFQKNAEISA